MKLTIDSDRLRAVLGVLIKVVPTRSNFPIFDDFLFEASADGLTITASDGMEVFLQARIPASETETLRITENGGAAFPARYLKEVVDLSPQGTLTLGSDNLSFLNIAWDSGETRLPAFPAEDYPKELFAAHDGSDGDTEMQRLTVPAAPFIDTVSGVAFCASDDPKRTVLMNVLLDFEQNAMRAVASDTRVLVCKDLRDGVVNAAAPVQLLMPKKAATMLRAIFGTPDSEMEVIHTRKYVSLVCGDTLMRFVQTEGRFPAYAQILPKSETSSVDIERKELMSVIKRVLICSSKANYAIQMSFSGDGNGTDAELAAQDTHSATKASEKVKSEFSGEQLNIAVTGPFLLDVLGNMSCRVVHLGFNGPKKPLSFRASDAEGGTGGDEIYGVQMPVLSKR